MPVWGIVLLVIIAVLVVALIVLAIIGNKLKKKQDAQQEQIEAAKQTMSMLVIDKKKMKLKDAGLPKMVLDQTPKYLRGTKTPIVQKTVEPKIEGAIITAKGAGDINVKTSIIQAVEAVTGLATHKIQVFTMSV